MLIPMESNLKVYYPPPSGSLPGRIFTLVSKELSFRDGVENLVPAITIRTKVDDYRYKKANATRIFKYAEYSLEAGDFWKSGSDPELLVQAEIWLQNGRKYTDFADKGKSWMTWVLLAILITPAVVIWLNKTKNKTGKT